MQSKPSTQYTLDTIRERVVNRSLVVFTVMSVPGLAASIFRATQSGWNLAVFAYAGLVLLLWCLVGFRYRLSAGTRGLVLLGILYAASVASFVSYGIVGNAPLSLITLAVIAALLFGRRGSILALVAGEILFVFMAVAITMQWISVAVDVNRYSAATSSWVNSIIVFGLLAGALIVLVDALYSALVEALGTARERAEHLEELARGLSVEIAERKRAEEALKREQVFTDAVLDSIPGLLYLYDEQGRLVRWNKQHEILTGYSAEELAGMGLLDWYRGSEQDIVAISRGVERCLVEGYAEAEGNLQTKSGKVIPFHFTAVRLEIDGKNYFAGIGIDITERRRAEEDRGLLQEQLMQAQKMESIGRLAGGVAHDFNNMLSIILGQGELILETLPTHSALREDITAIMTAGIRAKDLTRQLLAFSRKQVLDVRVHDLNAVVRGTERMIRRLLGEDINVQMRLHPENVGVKADIAQLEQVLMNLCVNARDAMPDGGKIAIETAVVLLDRRYAGTHPSLQPGSYVMLSVSDTGHGMDEDTRKRVFDPFFTTKEKGKGTGLGLATVYGIVKQHGGEILVYSEPGYGTTFKIYIPAAEKDLSEEIGKQECVVLPGHGETILVAEDEHDVRRVTCQMLSRLGYAPLEAQSADECLQCVQNGSRVDLLLTDVIMPGMNGRQLYERVAELRPGMKALFMSGYTDDVIGHHGVLDEGVCFISKPFTEIELSHKLREALDR